MLLHTRGLTAWIAANIVASAAFLHFASWTWLDPNLRGQDVARGGDALVWMVSAFPILMAAILGNVSWFVLVARERRKTEANWPTSATLLIAIIWVCAVADDHLRSLGF
jgi:hypothetical protein